MAARKARKKKASKKAPQKPAAAEPTPAAATEGAQDAAQGPAQPPTPEPAPAPTPAPSRRRRPFDGLQPGRLVHFRHAVSGKVRPAIVVEVTDAEKGTVDLTVFCARNEVYGTQPALLYPREVPHSATGERGTWSWPPRG